MDMIEGVQRRTTKQIPGLSDYQIIIQRKAQKAETHNYVT